jgi:hypothetical protein
MAKYWWQCTSCGDRPAWLTVCHSRSIAAFIWDELAPSGWDQRLLRRRCKCKRRSLRITYRFQRGDPERISIKHIVGLAPDGDYLPMLWDTFRHSSPRTHWIDFKYQRAAVLGASTNGWLWRRQDLRACCEPMNRRVVWSLCR